MKLACFSETTAPPIRRPLSPAASISRPAESPGGLRKTLPADGRPSGWWAWRQRRISSSRVLIVSGSAAASRNVASMTTSRGAPAAVAVVLLEPAVAVAKPEVGRRDDPSRSRRRRGPGPISRTAGDVGVVRAGVGPHRPADGARDRQAELEPGQARPAGSRSRRGPSGRRPRRCSARRRSASPRPGPG